MAQEAVPPGMPRPRRRLLLLVGLLVALSFVGLMLAATDGYFTPQVTDLYLVCQYAKAMAEGHPFRYNPGEPPSTGATSLLHTALLAAAHAAGMRGQGLVAFAILAGVIAYLASIDLARRIGGLLGDADSGTLAGALVALGGPLVWGYLGGSDAGLFSVLALVVFLALLRDWDRPRVPWALVAALSLAVLTRPEGVVVALVLAICWQRSPGGPVRRAAMWVPVAIGLAHFALNRLLTGTWSSTSVAGRSIFDNYSLPDSLALTTEYAIDVVRGVLLGLYPSQTPIGVARGWAPYYFVPLALLLALLAVLRAPEPLRRPLGAWLWACGAGALLAMPGNHAGVHFNRHLLWIFPTVHVLAALGLRHLVFHLFAAEDGRQRAWRLGAGAAIVLAGLSTARFAAHYAAGAGEVYRRDVAAARWIRQNLPPGATIANQATSIEYLTGHRNFNLHGVNTPAFLDNLAAERDAGTLESLARLAPAERPRYLLTTASQRGSVLVDLMARGAPLFRTSSLADEIEIHEARYDLVGTSHRPYLGHTGREASGLTEVDRLNVCDRRDERRHAYRLSSRIGDLALRGTPRVDTYAGTGAGGQTVADAGRAILGFEEFSVSTRPGQPLLVALRTADGVQAGVRQWSGSAQYDLGFPEARVALSIDGQTVAQVDARPAAGWDELTLRVGASAIRSTSTRLRVSGRYASFYYWFYQ